MAAILAYGILSTHCVVIVVKEVSSGGVPSRAMVEGG